MTPGPPSFGQTRSLFLSVAKRSPSAAVSTGQATCWFSAHDEGGRLLGHGEVLPRDRPCQRRYADRPICRHPHLHRVGRASRRVQHNPLCQGSLWQSSAVAAVCWANLTSKFVAFLEGLH